MQFSMQFNIKNDTSLWVTRCQTRCDVVQKVGQGANPDVCLRVTRTSQSDLKFWQFLYNDVLKDIRKMEQT